MSNLQQRTHAWWQARAPRERIMLTVMLLAVAACVAWYAVVVPLRHWHSSAQARYDLAAQAALRARATQRSASGPVPLARVLQSAQDAGIAITRQGRSATGALELQIDAVASAVLFAWLEQLRQRDNLAPSELTITRRDGQLQVRCVFPEVAA
ncbi:MULTISPECIES: type II secretion system protein GspM [unclassified Xanthomonas]|uniref:type II secretion system protein GspM n=1 Tax=unclassified Xanthomonas TaxID=2643310 RepID=UPI001619156B|nr:MULTISPECIES: type II secretion system protein GspM [unclassified Xanthomonas]MBB4131216.1 general secretion pathway protein M [Xanthomonas sp. 3075]MBB5864730.1 general secretion pathway protein M [Xanthomonas sp. 3058]